jgi:hypothetical protein
LLVVANVAVKFRRTGSYCRPTSRDYTFISLSAVDSRRKLNGFTSARHTLFPRDAASDARRDSHVNTTVSRCRHAWQLRRQTARTCDGNLQACYQRRTLWTDSLRDERFVSSSINHPLFMEPDGSLPRCQQPATCSCPESKDSSSHLHIL